MNNLSSFLGIDVPDDSPLRDVDIDQWEAWRGKTLAVSKDDILAVSKTYYDVGWMVKENGHAHIPFTRVYVPYLRKMAAVREEIVRLIA
jgi:hypothetical protein